MLDLIERRRPQLVELCRKHFVQRLELFGSAATGEGLDPTRSDLDFLVQFQPGHSPGPWLQCDFDFKADLEQLFGRPVDLVMPTALRNPYFARDVNRTRQTLYAA